MARKLAFISVVALATVNLVAIVAPPAYSSRGTSNYRYDFGPGYDGSYGFYTPFMMHGDLYRNYPVFNYPIRNHFMGR